MRGWFGCEDPVVFADNFYRKLVREIAPLKTGIDPVDQLSGVFSVAHAEKGKKIKLAGFICPLYEVDESRLDRGFGGAIVGIGTGVLEDFPRYEKKFARFMGVASSITNSLRGRFDTQLDVIMGDKGVINAGKFHDDLEKIRGANVDSYKNYMRKKYPDITEIANFRSVSDMAGYLPALGVPFSDLEEDGRAVKEGVYGFDINEIVSAKVANELTQTEKKGVSQYEALGFLLNYGLAGIVCRSEGVDILVGVDQPGSYMNYLYHAFIDTKDLFVVVPK